MPNQEQHKWLQKLGVAGLPDQSQDDSDAAGAADPAQTQDDSATPAADQNAGDTAPPAQTQDDSATQTADQNGGDTATPARTQDDSGTQTADQNAAPTGDQDSGGSDDPAQPAAARTAPNVGGCWKEGAAFESACVTFAQVLHEASGTAVDVGAVIGALDAGGGQLPQWLAAGGKSGALLATGYAVMDALDALTGCMDQDDAADKDTLGQMKTRRGALEQALKQAKQAQGGAS